MQDTSKWPALTVRLRKTTELTPYIRNSRTHSDEQVTQIAASIKEWGFTQPILVDETGMIIAGHGRLMAAQRLGLDQVPVASAKGWTDAQKKAYVIADNKLALNAGWDNDMLRIELDELAALDFDLDLTGFSLDEMANIFDEPDFQPGSEEDQGQLDQLDPKMVSCPHCCAEFDLRSIE
ncbi:MAG: ParB N-terminal domain-containing protein [Pseudomonadaceae bacterium]|nr:ParB N-terminal domain-containing protein [Pseudomonadaceae bacterium]